MERRILFAVDDTPASRAAVPVVAAFARASGAEVRVLHVIPDGQRGGGAEGLDLVRSFVQAVSEAGVVAVGQVRRRGGKEVAGVIAESAVGWRASLVAIGSRGRSDLAALVLGSVSHRAAAELDPPVLVVRSGADAHADLRRLLVCVDGRPALDEAVASAAQVAGATGAEARVLYVQRLVAAESSVVSVETDGEAQATVQLALARLQAAGVRATGETVTAPLVVPSIVAEARRWGADLVVLASRRPSDVRGLLLLSVAHEVIHRLDRPVLLEGRRRLDAVAAARWGAHRASRTALDDR
jgi:nucleotide-binding universal stress UspA family protein